MPRSALIFLPAALVAAGVVPAAAQEETPPALAPVVVSASRDEAGSARLGARDLAPRRAAASDTATLLKDIPGVNAYGAGGISSLPVVHGLADDRLRTTVDGMDLMTACPNHMNPALSFIDPSKVGSVEVFAGIAPVSVGGDSIGGTIQVNSPPPKFSAPDEGLLAEGEAGLFTRSNGNAHGKNGRFMIAGEKLNISYFESASDSDNYWAAGDFKLTNPSIWKNLSMGRTVGEREVGASEYRGSVNRELGVAVQPLRSHVIALSVSEQRLNYEGFPNQRMDMVASPRDTSDMSGFYFLLDKGKPSNVNRLANLRYNGQYGWGEIEARLFRQNLAHHMDLLPERMTTPYMPMDTKATTDGGMVKVSIDWSDSDILRLGYDFQKYRLNDWWPGIGDTPNVMCCDDFWNVRDGKRDRAYVFAEWEAQWTPQWLTLLGIRTGSVKSDAGQVQGYDPAYGNYRQDAARFNAATHARKDNHLDWTALVRHAPDATQTYEAGIARKTRSPNLYERYPWSYNAMAALMNNFVGDGNGYIGNPDLRPEVARTLSASGDWHDAAREKWNIKLTGYVTRVHDYIDAQRYIKAGSAGPTCNGTNMTTTNCYVLLTYANQEARLRGIDLSGQRLLGSISGIGSFTVTGMLSYVRGENLSARDNLYHIMPQNTKFSLIHRLGAWTNTLETENVEAKTRISQVRNEMRTPAYHLLNFYSSYQWKHARLDVGVENALNKPYLLPLGGAYLGQGNTMTTSGIPWGMTVPGRGRSLNTAFSVNF